jgi:hypothetical protein
MARRKTQTITQVLVHWDGLSPANATWKYIDELKLRFPQFNLEDKVGLKGGQLLPAEEDNEEEIRFLIQTKIVVISSLRTVSIIVKAHHFI